MQIPSDPDANSLSADHFFMTASSFNEAPGLPILLSTDMINWKLVNHALPDVFPIKHFSTPKEVMVLGRRVSDFITTNIIFIGPIQISGIYMVKTQNPFGKWEDPILVEEGKGIIDTCPFWDEDGNAYIVTWLGRKWRWCKKPFDNQKNECGRNKSLR